MTPKDEAALRAAEEIELVTSGRRSGRPHSVTLWSAYEDGTLWLRTDSDADWYRNLLVGSALPRAVRGSRGSGKVRGDRGSTAGAPAPD